MVDIFMADLKDAVKEAKVAPSGKGTMVAVYGACIFQRFAANVLLFCGVRSLTSSFPFCSHLKLF